MIHKQCHDDEDMVSTANLFEHHSRNYPENQTKSCNYFHIQSRSRKGRIMEVIWTSQQQSFEIVHRAVKCVQNMLRIIFVSVQTKSPQTTANHSHNDNWSGKTTSKQAASKLKINVATYHICTQKNRLFLASLFKIVQSSRLTNKFGLVRNIFENKKIFLHFSLLIEMTKLLSVLNAI